MRELFKIAWRNLWRNKRRTIITTSSVFFATFIALLVRAFQLGFYNYTLDSVIEHFIGHIQIRNIYYQPDNIDNLVEYSENIKQILKEDKEVKFFIARLESGAMAMHKDVSKACVIIGIEPVKEKKFSGIDTKLAKYKIDDSSIAQMTFLSQNQKNLLKEAKGYYYNKKTMLYHLISLSKDFSKYIDTIIKYTKFNSRYLQPDDNEILIASGIADFLDLNLGDSIILIGQGYHGVSAMGRYKVAGILALDNPLMNQTFIYMPLSLAQSFYSTYSFDNNGNLRKYVSYIAINTPYKASIRPIDYLAIEKVTKKLKNKIKETDIKILGWQEINKTLYQQIQTDNISGLIILMVIYIIIAFGVFGTVLMMMAERRKEFGVMLAIGMSRSLLKKIVILEIFILSVIGIILAIIVSYPLTIYLHYNPIYLGEEMAKAYEQFNFEPFMPTQLPDTYFIIQPLIILIMMMLTSIYPIVYLSKLKISKALRA